MSYHGGDTYACVCCDVCCVCVCVSPDELTIHEGDRVLGLVNNGDGWWVGELNGRKGMFPANYCRVCGLSLCGVFALSHAFSISLALQEVPEDEAKPDIEQASKAKAVQLSDVQMQNVRKLKRKPLPKLKLAYGAWGFYVREQCVVCTCADGPCLRLCVCGTDGPHQCSVFVLSRNLRDRVGQL
mgnify:CR=1 FL=1